MGNMANLPSSTWGSEYERDILIKHAIIIVEKTIHKSRKELLRDIMKTQTYKNIMEGSSQISFNPEEIADTIIEEIGGN